MPENSDAGSGLDCLARAPDVFPKFFGLHFFNSSGKVTLARHLMTRRRDLGEEVWGPFGDPA